MRVRQAIIDDIPELLILGQMFLMSSVYGAHFRENLDQIDALATHLITEDDGVVFVADAGEGKLQGAIGMWCSPHVWTGERTATELFWFVEPTARGSVGGRLFIAAKAWAMQIQASALHMVSPEVLPGEEDRVGKLYQKAGFVPLERGWILRLAA